MRISFYTLGCKANQAETAAMEQLVTGMGWQTVPFGTPCDAAVVNSCTVTATADKKSRQALRHAKALAPVVGVCGCFSQREGEKLVAEGLCNVAFGNRNHRAFLTAVCRAAQEHTEGFARLDEDTNFYVLPAAIPEGRTRALLKVQDGCENKCAYCIIPAMRGKNRCISPEDGVAQAIAAREKGARELVLTGIEVSSYRWEENGTVLRFEDLISRICAAVPDMRIRLGSLEPRTVTERFCALAEYENLCPQFHLSLQSGSDRILAGMRRQYNTARYEKSVELLRAAFPDVQITTDVIFGFPGETEEDFRQSLAFLKKIRFLKAHIFPYSVRVGTEAAQMPDQVVRSEKERRCRIAAGECAKVTGEILAGYVGRTLPVLCEDSPAPGKMQGYTPNYIPVVFDGGQELHNRVRNVFILKAEKEGLVGKIE